MGLETGWTIRWVTNVVYSIQMQQWENMWTKELKFTLCYSLKENLYKIMYRCYLSLDKLKIYIMELLTHKHQEGTFYHFWWTCKNINNYWTEVHIFFLKKGQYTVKTWNISFSTGGQKFGKIAWYFVLIQYVIIATMSSLSPMLEGFSDTMEGWLVKLMELAGMTKMMTD